MQTNISKNIAKIFSTFQEINKFPRTIIKYGFQVFLVLFFLGTFLAILNHTKLNYDTYFELIATSIIKNSFTVLAEVIIGSLIIDFIFKKN